MASIEIIVGMYVGFVVFLVALQLLALCVYCCKYDCMYLYTIYYNIRNCTCKKKQSLSEDEFVKGTLDEDTKSLPLIHNELYTVL